MTQNMKIFLGYKHKEWINKDGSKSSGYELYFARPVDPELGKGAEIHMRWRGDKKKFENWFVGDSNFEKIRSQADSLIGKGCEFFLDPDYGFICSMVPVK